MKICKTSLTISGRRSEVETSATCQLVVVGGEVTEFSQQQIQRLQNACLNAVIEQNGHRDKRSQAGSATLRQLAKLYRTADRLPAFDPMHLQNLSRRLYQKPVDGLSMLEVAGMTSTLNAVISGMVDAKEVLKMPVSPMNGHAGHRLS